MARIGVLLPARNAAATLEESLRSLASQTFPDFHCYVVDDGSTDETPSIAARFAAADRRFRLLRQPASGIVAALRRAVDESDEPWLARQDADDRSHPERLRLQVEHLEKHPQLDLVGTRVESLSEHPPTEGRRRYEAWLDGCDSPERIAREIWIECPIPHPTFVFRREPFVRAGGYQDHGWPEDYDLLLRLHRHGARMDKVRERLYVWRDWSGRASRTRPEYVPEKFLACKVHHLLQTLDGREVVIWGAGRDGGKLGRALLAGGGRVRGFFDIDPRKIGGTRHGRPVQDPEPWLSEAAGSRASDPEPAYPHPTAWTRSVPLVLAAVGTPGARELIRGRLVAAGRVEGRDFLCLA